MKKKKQLPRLDFLVDSLLPDFLETLLSRHLASPRAAAVRLLGSTPLRDDRYEWGKWVGRSFLLFSVLFY